MTDQYRKSSFCGSNACVEVAVLPEEVRVRTGDFGSHVSYTLEEWAAFVEGVKDGEFDLA